MDFYAYEQAQALKEIAYELRTANLIAQASHILQRSGGRAVNAEIEKQIEERLSSEITP